MLILVNTAAYSVRGTQWLDVCDGSDHYGSRRDERTALRFAYVLRVCACLCTASAQSGGTFIFLQDKEHLRTSLKQELLPQPLTDVIM